MFLRWERFCVYKGLKDSSGLMQRVTVAGGGLGVGSEQFSFCSEPKPLKGLQRKGKESEVVQSCPTLCDPMDCSLPGSSVHGIFQAIVLEWIAISFSRGSPRPRDGNWVSRVVDRGFTI